MTIFIKSDEQTEPCLFTTLILMMLFQNADIHDTMKCHFLSAFIWVIKFSLNSRPLSKNVLFWKCQFIFLSIPTQNGDVLINIEIGLMLQNVLCSFFWSGVITIKKISVKKVVDKLYDWVKQGYVDRNVWKDLCDVVSQEVMDLVLSNDACSTTSTHKDRIYLEATKL